MAVDIHIHGFRGIDTKDATPHDIIGLSKVLRENGITSFLPTVYPGKIENMRRDMESIKSAMDMQRLTPSSDQAKILGIYIEGPFLNPLKCGSLDPKEFLMPSEYNLKKLIEGFEDRVKIITIAPELEGAIPIIKKVTDMGIIVSMGHSNATYNEAEEGFNAGARGITHIFNAMRAFHHRELGISGFALLNPYVYIEIIADLHHIHKKALEMVFMIKKHNRIIVVSDAVRETGLKSPIDKNNTLKGGFALVTETIKNLNEMGLDDDSIVRCIKDNPLNYLNEKTSIH